MCTELADLIHETGQPRSRGRLNQIDQQQRSLPLSFWLSNAEHYIRMFLPLLWDRKGVVTHTLRFLCRPINHLTTQQFDFRRWIWVSLPAHRSRQWGALLSLGRRLSVRGSTLGPAPDPLSDEVQTKTGVRVAPSPWRAESSASGYSQYRPRDGGTAPITRARWTMHGRLGNSRIVACGAPLCFFSSYVSYGPCP